MGFLFLGCMEGYLSVLFFCAESNWSGTKGELARVCHVNSFVCNLDI